MASWPRRQSGRARLNAPLPTALGDLGFDYSYIMAATADRAPAYSSRTGRWRTTIGHPDLCQLPEELSRRADRKDNPELLYNQKPSFGHDQSIVNGISRIGYMKGGGKALWKDENIADSIVTHAIDFIKENKEKPFFMYFATNDVHVPRFPHDRFRERTRWA